MSRESGRLTVVHISDVHATADGRLYGAIDGRERLQAVANYLDTAGVTPEAVVITGDLVQRGEEQTYPVLRDALDRFAAEVQVPVLTVIGNHDAPDAARILPGHENGHYRVVTIDDLRFVLLDSSPGALGAEQREWLADSLRAPHGTGTIIALHHPPLGSPLPTMAKAGLRDHAEFFDAIEGSDVRAVLAGHFHHPLSATLHGIPISVGPSLAYHQVMDAGPDTVSGHDRAMFSLVHLPTAGGMTATSVTLESPAPLFSLSLTPTR